MNKNWVERLAEKIELEQRTEFIRFVTTGEASYEFLSHLDVCLICQNAVEEAFQITSRNLEALAKEISKKRNRS